MFTYFVFFIIYRFITHIYNLYQYIYLYSKHKIQATFRFETWYWPVQCTLQTWNCPNICSRV